MGYHYKIPPFNTRKTLCKKSLKEFFAVNLNTINMNTCCVSTLGRSTTTLPSFTSMRPLRTCSFSRHVLLLCFSSSSSSSFSLSLPFSPSSLSPPSAPLYLYLPNHLLSFILQIKVGSRFTGNHLSADLFLVHSQSQENRINILHN